MGKIKSCNIFSTFVADFIEKYGISDYEERKFIANCFLNFVNSIESADDIQRLLCILRESPLHLQGRYSAAA